jgi:hypothetical protein
MLCPNGNDDGAGPSTDDTSVRGPFCLAVKRPPRPPSSRVRKYQACSTVRSATSSSVFRGTETCARFATGNRYSDASLAPRTMPRKFHHCRHYVRRELSDVLSIRHSRVSSREAPALRYLCRNAVFLAFDRPLIRGYRRDRLDLHLTAAGQDSLHLCKARQFLWRRFRRPSTDSRRR